MLTEAQRNRILDTCEAPRITEASIKENIHDFRFYLDGYTTICVIEMRNGFKFIGHSTPAHPENYRSELGEQYAYDNAFKQIWSHMGFLLRDQIARGEK